MSRADTARRGTGFSLVELVIVVVIIAIIGAIAIPRMSRGAAGAADSALAGDLAVLRNAIDLYATEHGGTFPTAATFMEELTQFTSSTGATSTLKDTTHIYGPYLRRMPPLPVGSNKGETDVADAAAGAVIGVAGSGWFYNEETGELRANLPDTETDAAGKPWNLY